MLTKVYSIDPLSLMEIMPGVTNIMPAPNPRDGFGGLEDPCLTGQEVATNAAPVNLAEPLRGLGIPSARAMYTVRQQVLVLSATREHHLALAELLSAFRPVQVELEVRFVRVHRTDVEGLDGEKIKALLETNKAEQICAPRITTLPGIAGELSSETFPYHNGEFNPDHTPTPLPPDPGLRINVLPMSVSTKTDSMILDVRFRLETVPAGENPNRKGFARSTIRTRSGTDHVVGGFADPENPGCCYYAWILPRLVHPSGRPLAIETRTDE